MSGKEQTQMTNPKNQFTKHICDCELTPTPTPTPKITPSPSEIVCCGDNSLQYEVGNDMETFIDVETGKR